ncbi:substrate-binding domain-containing protein [Patulibacter sp.]|uniref:sugar ABC transporter substrate-binding protein n=1 Tax=Patulibacter sp. TaxID=1912859 RepID=UPI002717642F|nr:substrate-binding domain-containing protein [Patulibacter sp.]MDO9407714.1 substrate-binding domain-containing protein [Patulibacter sp.]
MLHAPRSLVTVACALTVGLFAAGCGGDESSDGASTSAGSSAAASTGPFASPEAAAAFKAVTGLDALEKPATKEELAPRVAAYQEVPTKLLATEPVSKKAEPGKEIAILYTGVPIAIEYFEAQKQAAELLGWKVTGIDVGTSPEEFAQAYDRAIGLKPDMVIGSGIPREYLDKQLTELERLKIPVIQWSSGVKPVDGALYVAVDDPLYMAAGIQTSEFLAADGDMKADVVGFSVKQYAMIDVFTKSIDAYMEKMCAECSFDLQQVAASDVGKLAPKVTAYLQQHPDTKYVLCGFGDLCQGVGTALKAAGRSDVKIITRDPASTNYQNIANGQEWAGGALPIGQTSWQVIDLAQRVFNGDDTTTSRLMPQQIVTDVPDPKSPLIGSVPDYQKQYRALWKLDD